MGKWAEGDFWRNFSIGIDIFERTWYYLFSDDECEVCVSKMKTKEEESGKVWPIQFCSHCGARLRDGVKFCENCGEAVSVKVAEPIDKDTGTERKTERSYIYDGVVHKCPNCGEVLGSFELNCPACGYELRNIGPSSAIKEFTLKLERIESEREFEKRGFFKKTELQQSLSRTDERKISLIKSFPVPNSKEDMLEFMILAVSNVNTRVYDYDPNITKGEKEVNAAWISKIQQVFEKAKRSFSSDDAFIEITTLYNQCNAEIKKAKKRVIVKTIAIFGWIPLGIIIIIINAITYPKREAKELQRLNVIVSDIQTALNNEEYKHALRIADSIEFQLPDTEKKREWDICREYWIDKVIEKAEDHGIELEYTPETDSSKSSSKTTTDEIQENVDEFNSVINKYLSKKSEP